MPDLSADLKSINLNLKLRLIVHEVNLKVQLQKKVVTLWEI